MAKKTPVYIVSQTHWDREWYFTFEQFRFRLVGMIDRLLELLAKDKRYRCFMLDGQTCVLEDYLEIRPEKEEELRRRVRQGRLVIGPWYVMPDEFLVSGESLIRNFLRGRRVGRPFGGVSTAGYIPDPFGHIAQMPQILRGFGMDSMFFMRGMPAAKGIGTEFRWQAPDRKSEVYAVWQKNGYGNASLLGYSHLWGIDPGEPFKLPLAMERIEKEIQDLSAWNRCGALLLNNGVDHVDAQPELPRVLAAARKHFPGYAFHHATLEDYAREVRRARRRLKVVRGELRSARYYAILCGVLSSRMYLKQYNRHCEFLLERWAEPTTALARHLGGPDHSASVRQAWKYLLQNHPHDSICGCSIDAVHREMMTRFEKAAQLAETIIEANQKAIASHIDTRHAEATQALVVWNSLPGRRHGPLDGQLVLPEGAGSQFRILAADGTEVPTQVAPVGTTNIAPFGRPHQTVRQVNLTLERPAVGIGYETLWLAPARKKRPSTDAWAARANRKGIETDHYKITFHPNGTFDLYDKQTRRRYPRQLLFEDTEDIGDGYDYSPARQGRTLTTERVKARIRIVERGPLFVTYEVTLPWRLPVGMDKTWTRRRKATRPFPIRTRMRVYRKERRIEFRTEVDNQVKDHRLRVHFEGPSGATHSEADGHFGVIRRPIEVRTTRLHDQPEPITFHQRFFTSLSDGKGGLAVLNRRLTEYEVLKQKRGRKVLAVTLLRAVQYLSNGHLLTRRGNAGPEIETPESQCPGVHRYEYALLPFPGRDVTQSVTPEAEAYANPARFTLEALHEGPLPSQQRFVTADDDSLVWSAWKPAEEGAASVFRFYNPGGPKRKVRLEVAEPLRMAERCDLKEEAAERAQGGRRKTTQSRSMQVDPYEMVSLRIV